MRASRLALFAPLAAVLGLAALMGLGLWRGHPDRAPVAAVRPLPPFDLEPLEPGGARLSRAGLAGRPAWINVFASWCPSCAGEQPTLAEIARSGGAPLYGVAWLDKPDDTRAWLQRHGDPYARIGQDASGRLGVDLGVTGAPETFLVDAQGRIRYRQIGPIDERTWRTVLQPLQARVAAEASDRPAA